MRLFVCLALLTACAPQETHELPSLDRDESIDPAQVLPETAVLEEPPGQEPAQEPVPAELAGDEALAGAFAGLSRVMAAMREASIEAAEASSTPCEAGRASYAAAIEAAATTLEAHPLPGGRQPQTLVLASPERYEEICAALPLALQRCARFDYKMANPNECETALLAVSDEERAAFDELAQPAE